MTEALNVSASYTKAGGKECIRQNRLLDLDIPISDNIYYVVKTTSDAEYIIKNRDEVRKRYDQGKVKVVSLLKVIDGPCTTASNAFTSPVEFPMEVVKKMLEILVVMGED